jgi:hypothetical protein
MYGSMILKRKKMIQPLEKELMIFKVPVVQNGLIKSKMCTDACTMLPIGLQLKGTTQSYAETVKQDI